MSRHEAEQFEMPLVESPENPMEFLLKEDPILDLITRAKRTLEELKAVEHDNSIKAIIEVEHIELQANRINKIEELEKLVISLKSRFLRSLGGCLLRNEKKK